MSVRITIGSRLIALKERSGLSLAKIAHKAGYQGASSIQKLFRIDYDPDKLQPSVADKLAPALTGLGDPPIRDEEIFALTGKASSIDKAFADVAHYSYLASAFIGIHQTRRMNEQVIAVEGFEVPLFARVDVEDGIPFHPCPDHLRPRGIVGMYVTIGNMWPRYEEGEPIFYEHKNPPRQGDDVILTLVSDTNLDGGMILGRLALLHEDEVQIDQLAPRGRLVFARRDVISIHRVLHASDLLPALSYARAS